MSLLSQKVNQTEIAETLGTTRKAIERRVARLRQEGPVPVRPGAVLDPLETSPSPVYPGQPQKTDTWKFHGKGPTVKVKTPKTFEDQKPYDPAELEKTPVTRPDSWLRKVLDAAQTSSAVVDKADYWKRRYLDAEARAKQLLLERAGVDELCAVARELAPKAYDTAPPIPNIPPRTGGTPQDAVLLLSDTHIGKNVFADQTLGLGCYNFNVFLRRLARLERSIHSILQDHTTTAVPTIHVCMLGDMLDGALVHSVEAGQHNTLFEQFYSAGHALAQFLRGLSQRAKIEVWTSVGNHTRWQNQHKMPTTNVYSNLDQFLYAYVQALAGGCANFHLDKQPFARFKVQGWNFLATHGTHLRGGDRVLGIPAHAIGRNVMAHSQLSIRAGDSAPNYYCVGHLHRPIELPHTLGDFIVNGGFPGVDGFGLMEAFNSSYPMQKFFLVHPRFGKTAEYKLRLDLGDSEEHHYTLPAAFCCQ